MKTFCFRSARPLLAALVLCLTIHLLTGISTAKQTKQPKSVLVFHSYHKGLTWTDAIAAGIEAHFSNSDQVVEISHEFMDTKRIFSPAYLAKLADLYQTKYANQEFAVIISSDDHAFNFLRKFSRKLFGRPPVVFCGVNYFEPQMIEGRPEFTGVLESFDIANTLNIALTLHPTAGRLVVIGDQTLSGKANKKLFDNAIQQLDRPIDIVYLDNHSMAEVQAQVSLLGETDIAIWLHFTADREGKFYSFQQSAQMISSHSGAPLYSFWDFHLGHGIVGGMLTSGFHQGQTAATLADRIIHGEAVANIRVIEKSPNRYMFDYKQLKRFKVDMDKLPSDGIVISRPITFYSQYRKIVWIVVGSFTILSTIIIMLLVNITHRRRAEKALKTARDRYQNMFNNTAVALFESDITALKQTADRLRPATQKEIHSYLTAHPEIVQELVNSLEITDANPAALQLYGAGNTSDLTGSTERFFNEESLDTLTKIIGAIVEKKTYFASESVSKRLDGQPLHVILSINFPVHAVEWNRIVICVVDITDRIRSLEAFRRSEDRFRTVFNHAASGMAMADLDGKYIRCNAAFCNMLGYSEKELQQKNWRDITHEEDIGLTKQLLNQLFQGRKAAPKEKRYIHNNGQIVWALFNVSQITSANQQPLYYIVQTQDITQIKATQARFKAREDRYRHVFEADLSGFYIAKPEGEIILCNNVFADILGIESSHAAVGLNLSSFYKDPQIRQQLVAQLAMAKRLKHIEVELVRSDGATIHARLNAIGRFDAEGDLTEVLGYLMDITHQKSLEAQLLHAQKMESIGTMAGGIAHDFNNLLMGIMGNASLLMRGKDQQQKDYKRIKSIEQYAKSGSDLTRQLLGFAKGGKYEVRAIDLNRLIERNVKMFARTHKDIKVRTSLADDLRAVEADQSQIDQVLYNMYVNAWQAMENGGDLTVGTLNRTLKQSDVAAHGVKAGDYVQISVDDSGAGMDAETIQRIFDPFFTTKERGRGTGLGLASAYGIIKNHAGFIEAHSQVNQGTTFSILLPASVKSVETQRPEPKTELTSGSETILLIDDEDIVIESVGGMIEYLGYGLVVARSGKEAIQIYEANRGVIDLVILDMIMPDMNGGETFDRLKAIDPGVLVILSTGYSAEGQANDILERGCQGLISKPFTLTDLSDKLDRVLRLSSDPTS